MTQQSHSQVYTLRKLKWKKTHCIPLFTAALFVRARRWKQPRCPSTDEHIKKLWYTYTMEYSVQFTSVIQLCPTLCDPMDYRARASLPITNSRRMLKLMSVESVMPPNHLSLCRPLLLPPSMFPSNRVFSNESVLCTGGQSQFFSIRPSNEYSGMISFRMDWIDLLAVQGTLKSLLQHHSSKASILQHSAFFIKQLYFNLKKECREKKF